MPGADAMPSLEWNKGTWDGDYDWSRNGDEWSAAWGTPAAQWQFSLLPRVFRYLPAGTVLELAPGCGRWTRYLKDLCVNLVVVDYSESCIAKCRQRFRADSHVTFHVNDGRTLPMVETGSVDFAFSFDSLVHADLAVVAGYVGELARVLAPDGVAWVHHSNLAAVVPAVTDKTATEKAWHHRGTDVSAAAVEAAVTAAGLVCIGQELLNWGVTPDLTDCVTQFARPGGRFARPNAVVPNPDFMADAARIGGLAGLYG